MLIVSMLCSNILQILKILNSFNFSLFPGILQIGGEKLIFIGGHISLVVAFEGPNVISTP